MTTPSADSRSEALPTLPQAALFALKASLFRLRRSWRDPLGPSPRPLPFQALPPEPEPAALATVRSPLYTQESDAEWALQAGKIQNLRVAAHALHGRVLAPQAIFSFWANVGRPIRRRGFVAGRELRAGCIIPSVGGGLCQLSNALYEAALQAGLEIVERHAHSRRVPGSPTATDRDATVFWNYVDLRFRSDVPLQFDIRLTATELLVTLLGQRSSQPRSLSVTSTPGIPEEPLVESCETCNRTDCFRHPTALALPQRGGTAWLVDAWMPEHDAWMAAHRTRHDCLLLPLASRRLHLGPYRWSSAGFAAVRQAPWTTLRRSLTSRRLATQGAARQRALLALDEALARAFIRRLPPLATHLVVSQNLLPFLWRAGVLGGRTFDVFMTRLPLHALESVLDRAAQAHPESPTLADFRADPAIVAAESAALAAARQWITPHTAIAALAGDRACLLDWQIPSSARPTLGDILAFPASTLGRKGAYELRQLARELQRPVRLGGPILEHPDFWSGLTLAPAASDWLTGVAAVILPAWVEHQPRRLLRAVAAGIPVIATEACGLLGVPGVTTVPCGDPEALREALASIESTPPSLTLSR